MPLPLAEDFDLRPAAALGDGGGESGGVADGLVGQGEDQVFRLQTRALGGGAWNHTANAKGRRGRRGRE